MLKRNRALLTRFTQEEFLKVLELQGLTGLKGEEFRRNAILGVCIKEAPPNEFPEFIRLLRKLNSAAYEIMTQLNSMGISASPDIRKLINDTYEFERKVYSVLSPYEEPKRRVNSI